MGCNDALNRYFNWLIGKLMGGGTILITQLLIHYFIDKVGTPLAPALVADSLTATSLSLEWEIPPKLIKYTKGKSNMTKSYLVQWRYEVGDWTFCLNRSMGENSTVRVDNLQPYTQYRVK